jgi:hypothetical protein
MTKKVPVTGFSSGERDYIRRELDMFFSTLPTVAEGFQLKTWSGGREAGKAEGPARRPIASGPWADASRYQPAPADCSLPMRGLSNCGGDGGRPPPSRSETIDRCPTGARHRSRADDRGAARVRGQSSRMPLGRGLGRRFQIEPHSHWPLARPPPVANFDMSMCSYLLSAESLRVSLL